MFQFILIILIAFYAGGFEGVVENIMMISGVSLGLWAVVTMKLRVNIFPDVRNNQQLFTSGPYKYIRHPMYTAVLLVTLAWVLQRIDFVSVGMWLLLLLVLIEKLNYEEKLLLFKFKKYKSYMQKTKRLLPLVY